LGEFPAEGRGLALLTRRRDLKRKKRGKDKGGLSLEMESMAQGHKGARVSIDDDRMMREGKSSKKQGRVGRYDGNRKRIEG
jgi:hypothetical protein